jgi:hypothetical protein
VDLAQVTLLWLPVGAGTRVVIHTSRWWEFVIARRDRRASRPLFHAALDVVLDGEHYVVEMAPAWGLPAAERGVVATGPVGMPWLGRFRLFRYEVRRWRDGILPDRRWAVGQPLVLSEEPVTVRSLFDAVPRVPALAWGRRVTAVDDMWNSNSLISWLLVSSGIPADLHPPDGGRAPGWAAGLAVASGSIAR